MKHIKITALSCAIAFAFSAEAQQVNYSILQNDPENYKPKINVNLDLMQFDFNLKSIESTSFNIGSWGFIDPIKAVGFNYSIRKSWLALGALGNKQLSGNLELEAGAYLFPFSRTKSKKIKVSLKHERYQEGGKEYEKETYVMVPGGNRVISKGFRGGLYYKKSPYSVNSFDNATLEARFIEQANIATMGVYVGLVKRHLTNIVVDLAGYGKRGTSAGDDVYFDVLVLPVTNFTNASSKAAPAGSVDSDIKDNISQPPIGFRLGWTRYQIAPRSVTGRRFGPSAKIEIGYKPWYGIFFNAGIGMTIVKIKK